MKTMITNSKLILFTDSIAIDKRVNFPFQNILLEALIINEWRQFVQKYLDLREFDKLGSLTYLHGWKLLKTLDNFSVRLH